MFDFEPGGNSEWRKHNLPEGKEPLSDKEITEQEAARKAERERQEKTRLRHLPGTGVDPKTLRALFD